MLNDHLDIPPMMTVPTELEAMRAVEESQRMFARTLSCWAVDVLRLRRKGFSEAVWNSPRYYSKAA